MFKAISCCEALVRILHPHLQPNIGTSPNISLCVRLIRFSRLDLPHRGFKTYPSIYSTNVTNREKEYSVQPKATVVALLVQELGDKYRCTSDEVHSMFERCPALAKVPFRVICNNLNYFRNLGISRNTLVKNPWILTYSNKTYLPQKLNLVQSLQSDINVSLPLLELPLRKLEEMKSVAAADIELTANWNRIDYLSKQLDCKPEEIIRIAVKYPFILVVPRERLEAICELLADAGVSARAILKDVWVFRYSVQAVEARLNRAKEAGLKNIKPWVVRCPEATLQKTVNRYVTSREALGSHSNLISYLCQRLECSPDMLEFIFKRTPQMLRVSVGKWKEVLDYLYAEGFTPQQVCQVPRVVNYRLETLQGRLAQLRKLGYNPHSLIVLCKTRREYAEIVKKVQSLKNRTLKENCV